MISLTFNNNLCHVHNKHCQIYYLYGYSLLVLCLAMTYCEPTVSIMGTSNIHIDRNMPVACQ